MCKLSVIFAFCLLPFAFAGEAGAAAQIKKAAPVAAKASGGTEGAASLVPSVLGLVTGVMQMNSQMKALTGECLPSAAERTFVDNTMKEWAKAGQTTAKSMQSALKRTGCSETGSSYEADAQISAPGILPCYNQFVDATDTDAIWYGFPKTGYASYCKNGMATCADKDKETMSDTYSLFLQIDFAPADYLSGEATMAAKLLGRVESCTDAKLSAKKRAMWGEFLVNTAGSLGQKTNTGSIMEQVGAMTSGGGGAMGALGSIGGIATQFMAK